MSTILSWKSWHRIMVAWPGASMRTQTLHCSSRYKFDPRWDTEPVCLPFVTYSPATLQDFYHEVANPLLLSVAFEYPSDAVEVVTQDNFRHHFKGSEMVVAGKLQDQGLDVLSAKISGQMVSVAQSSWSQGAAGATWEASSFAARRTGHMSQPY